MSRRHDYQVITTTKINNIISVNYLIEKKNVSKYYEQLCQKFMNQSDSDDDSYDEYLFIDDDDECD